jgi:hypothetical protein
MQTTLTPWRPGLGMTAWDNASNYIGETLKGWFVYSKHRDSDLLTESNFDHILAALNTVATAAGNPNCIIRPVVNHWAVGWVEQICLTSDAPEPVIREAERLLAALEDYPALDEDDWSEREWDAAANYWDSLSPRDKVREAIDIRDGIHWLAKTPAWPIGRLSFGELANAEERWPWRSERAQLASYVYERVRESCQ